MNLYLYEGAIISSSPLERELICKFKARDFKNGEIKLNERGRWFTGEELLSPQTDIRVREAAIFLGLSEQRIRALIKARKITVRKLNVQVIRAAELIEFARIDRPNQRKL